MRGRGGRGVPCCIPPCSPLSPGEWTVNHREKCGSPLSTLSTDTGSGSNDYNHGRVMHFYSSKEGYSIERKTRSPPGFHRGACPNCWLFITQKKPGRPGQLPCLVGKPPFGKKNARAAYSKEDKMKRSLGTPPPPPYHKARLHGEGLCVLCLD